MPSALPAGDPVPDDGTLPASALTGLGERTFSVYVHVPFCAVRCGYCDFNTYTADELGPGVSRATYAETAISEVRLARRVLGDVDLPVETIFVGGGTPTLLAPGSAGRCGRSGRRRIRAGSLAPRSPRRPTPTPSTLADLEQLRESGFTRISFGMQSSVSHVLRVLDRTHDPARVPDVVEWARAAGFEQVSLDLIYGTPGESLADWGSSVEAALACAPDHVSAYSLIVEDGTALARQVRRGEVPMPDNDDLADKYTLVDERLTAAGLGWYEVSNWARDDAARCRHNLAYWRGGDWWGIGPGAHSHVGGTRWWNVKHPSAYADRLGAGRSPAHAREVLDDETRRVERVLLEVRLRDGLPLDVLDADGRAAATRSEAEGLSRLVEDRLVLTARGRLLADALVLDLL